AVRRIQDPDIVRFGLGNQDRLLALATDPALRFPKVEFTPTDGYVLSRVDGTLSARDIAQMIPLPSEDVERSLLGLLCTGAIGYLAAPKKPPARPAPSAPAAHAPSGPSPSAPGATAKTAAAQAPAAASDVDTRRQEITDASERLKARNHFEVLGIP